jgi:hypothetical protein
LIHAYLRGKYEREAEAKIFQRKEDMVKKNGGVEEDEWVAALRFMYNDDDVKGCSAQISNWLSEEKERRKGEAVLPGVKKSKIRIPYNDLLKV